MPIKAGERASEIQIKRFEKNHGINLPESYRAFMRQYGGGTPDPCWYIDAARNVELYVGFVFPLSAEQMAEQTFPFPPPAECGFVTVATNTGGDYFLLDLATEEIFYWRHEADDLPPSHADLLWVGSNIGEVIDRLEYLPGEGPEEVDEIETIGASGDVEQLDDFVRRNGVSARGKSGMTVAETAARDGNLAVLRRCIELGVARRVSFTLRHQEMIWRSSSIFWIRAWGSMTAMSKVRLHSIVSFFRILTISS